MNLGTQVRMDQIPISQDIVGTGVYRDPFSFPDRFEIPRWYRPGRLDGRPRFSPTRGVFSGQSGDLCPGLPQV